MKLHFNRLIIAAVSLFIGLFCFTSYSAEHSCIVKIPVSVITTGDTYYGDYTYEFEIEASSSNAVLPSITIVKASSDGDYYFPEITLTKPADYVYLVKQHVKSAEGFTYDTQSYKTTVRVLVHTDGTLYEEIWVTDELNQKVTTIIFENTYTRPYTPAPPGGGNKPGSGLIIQTGTRVYMIPILITLGIVCIVLGIIILSRRKDEDEIE